MSRLDDIQLFYEILGDLEQKLGGARRLHGCNGRMNWPTRGVYFFFENGENRSSSGTGPRLVRVGTHALTCQSRATLWRRLSQHRGVAKNDAGNHRGSIFRLLVGEALIHRDGIGGHSWGIGGSASEAASRLQMESLIVSSEERPVEVAVSGVVRAMPFVWVQCDDQPDRASKRGIIERNAIALLSNFDREPIDPASTTWLGAFSARERVRRSGLWNNNHVDEPYDRSFLDVLAAAVASTPALGPVESERV